MTILTNLATTVLVGVIFSALRFAWETGTRLHGRHYKEDGLVIYELHGPLFLGAAQGLAALFEPANDPAEPVADFRFSRLHDHSTLDAVHMLANRYQEEGKILTLSYLSQNCRRILHSAGDTVEVSLSEHKSHKPKGANASEG